MIVVRRNLTAIETVAHPRDVPAKDRSDRSLAFVTSQTPFICRLPIAIGR